MTEYKKNLLSKISDKNLKICIVGLGYVGLPLVFSFASAGFKVIGLDNDKKKINSLKNNKSYINQFKDNKIKELNKTGFSCSAKFKIISTADVIIYCIPTPLNVHKEPDMKYIESSLNQSIPFLKKGQAVSLESTTYPGTTEEYFVKMAKGKGYNIGKDFFVIYSPEREDPGNNKYSVSNIPKVVSGHTKNCLKIANNLYESLGIKTVSLSSLKAAETTKLLENIYRSINIGMINELKILLDKMDIDIYEVINAAKTKPFGFKAFYPGPGLGGHCIPIDPFLLTWKAKEYDFNTRFIELSGQINDRMPEYVCDKVVSLLNNNNINISKSKILILGVAYKKNVDDIRESPALKIIDILKNKKAKVSYSDPLINKINKTRKYDFNMKSVKINKLNLKKFDLTLIVTDHDLFDYKIIKENSKFIVDCRGRINEKKSNIIQA